MAKKKKKKNRKSERQLSEKTELKYTSFQQSKGKDTKQHIRNESRGNP